MIMEKSSILGKTVGTPLNNKSTIPPRTFQGSIFLLRVRLVSPRVKAMPPIGNDRTIESGTWQGREIKASRTSWEVNSIDVVTAGFGLVIFGFERAPFPERPGFWLPKAISDALGSQSKLEAQRRKNLEDETELLAEISS